MAPHPETESSACAFLVVEDDPNVAASVVRMLRRFGTVRVVTSVAEARQSYRPGQVRGLIADVLLPDGSGLEFAEEVRARDGLVPILVMTGLADRAHANRAHRIHAAFIHKPFRPDDIALFAERALAPVTSAVSLAAVCADLAARHRLSRSETHVLALTLKGYDVSECAAVLGVQECTVRAHRASILRKTCFATIAALLQTALRRTAEGAAAAANNDAPSVSGVRPIVRLPEGTPAFDAPPPAKRAGER